MASPESGESLGSVGERLLHARTLAGVSQRELDRLAGKAEGHCGLIEARHSNVVRTDTVAAYADALGVSRSWLAWGQGPPRPANDDASQLAKAG